MFRGGEGGEAAPVLVHHENLPDLVDIRSKEDPPVGEKAAKIVVGPVAGQAGLGAAVEVHQVNFAVRITVGNENDFVSVGGKIRRGVVVIVFFMRGDAHLVAAVGSHQEDFVISRLVAGERDQVSRRVD